VILASSRCATLSGAISTLCARSSLLVGEALLNLKYVQLETME